jgi:dephospho-CoA kinase
MLIIGVAGTNGSGKDTIAKVLSEKHDFYAASATDMLGAELTRRGLPHERENKRTVSAEWRREHGLGVIVDKAVEEAKTAGYTKLVVGSLRNPGEVDKVHELGGEVIWVDSDPRVRYDRIQKNNRGRVEDAKTYEQFLAEEEVEMSQSGDSATLSLSGVKAKSDRFIDNDSNSIEDFAEQIEKALVDLL